MIINFRVYIRSYEKNRKQIDIAQVYDLRLKKVATI